MSVFKYLLVGALLFSVMALAREYQVLGTEKNMVKFISDAPIEEFEGVTSEIDGYLIWNGPDKIEDARFYFEVDLNSLDTGIGLRNRHMCENYLQTDQFPKAWYEGRITEVEKKGGGVFAVKTSGKFNVHGVARPLQLVGTLIENGDRLRIKSEFQVKLSDHKIKIPSIMFYKIDENMKVVVDFVVKTVEEES